MSEKSFWDRFYRQHNKSSFEWIVDTSSIGEILSQIDSQKTKQKRTLLFDAGCGSSLFSTRLSESISAANFLICGDFSSQALELIKSNSSQQTHVDFVQCDCKALPFRDNIFDIIIGKFPSRAVLFIYTFVIMSYYFRQRLFGQFIKENVHSLE